MNLRNRLTIYSTITFGIVFCLASLLIFLAYYKRAQDNIFSELENTTLLSAIYYLEQDELPQNEHSVIRDQFRTTILSKNVAVINATNAVEFGQLIDDPNITDKILSLVRKNETFYFKKDNSFYYGMFYPDNQGDFVVFTKEPGTEYASRIKSLLLILGIVLLLGLMAIYLLSRYISNVAYKPIKNIVQQVNEVNYSNLEQGIAVPKTDDELEELITTYNKLLARLSESFLVQKNFINYVSHEFKTPLTAISGSLEVFAQKERSPEEYKQVTQEALDNVYKIESILSNLLLLSGLKNAEHQSQLVRIDELIWDINEALHNKLTEFKTQLHIDIQVSDFSLLEFKGNETLIHLALYNIIENAIKYSNNNPVEIVLKSVNSRLNVVVTDHGKGIAPDDLTFIKQTFYRGKNVGNIKGSGIGLSLATIIFDQHSIGFDIQSSLKNGTVITLTF